VLIRGAAEDKNHNPILHRTTQNRQKSNAKLLFF